MKNPENEKEAMALAKQWFDEAHSMEDNEIVKSIETLQMQYKIYMSVLAGREIEKLSSALNEGSSDETPSPKSVH